MKVIGIYNSIGGELRREFCWMVLNISRNLILKRSIDHLPRVKKCREAEHHPEKRDHF